MAVLTASISLSSASCIQGQSIQAVVTVSNSNAYDVNITEIKPTMIFTGNSASKDGSSFSASNILLGQGFNNVVPASSSAKFMFFLSPYEPSVNFNHTPGTYDVSCHITSNNGDFVTPTAATLTVNPVPKEASTP